jgi:hypothetical protein
MPLTIDRDGARTRANDQQPRRHGGQVVLATFASTPFESEAARLAVDAAAHMQSTVLAVDLVEVRPGRHGAGRAADPVSPAHAAALRAVGERASDLGVPLESRRVAGVRPVIALLDLVAEHRPALVVFATDPAALRRFRRPTRRQYRRFVAALAEQAPCLLWTAQEPVADAAVVAARRAAKARRAQRRRAGCGNAAARANLAGGQIATTAKRL